MNVTELIAQYTKTNTQNLKTLRNGATYDVLESILHQSTMLMMVNKLKLKIIEAKEKYPNADLTEQVKMIEDLSEVIFWMDGLQKQYEALRTRYVSTEHAIKDLHWLNQIQEKRIEELEKQIKIFQSQTEF